MPSGLHTWSKTAGSNNSADSGINWAEGQAPSTVNDSARGMMAVVAKWRDDNNGSLTTGGTSTAYTLTTNTVFTTLALMDGATVAFAPHATSGATPTLNVDGLGAKVIRNTTSTALPTGALVAGSVYRMTYFNSTGEWLITNQPGLVANNAVATASIQDDAVTYAKMQNVSTTARILGRATSGSGNVEEIPLAGGLSISGGSLTSSQTATNVASQSDQETATSTTTFVSPGRQQYHPSAAKAWAFVGSTGTIQTGYNAASTTHPGTGSFTLTFTNAMSSASYAVLATVFGAGGVVASVDVTNQTTTTITYYVVKSGVGGADLAHYIAVFGDQ